MRVFLSLASALVLVFTLSCSSDVSGPASASQGELALAGPDDGSGYGDGEIIQDSSSEDPGSPAKFHFELFFSGGPQGTVLFQPFGRPAFQSGIGEGTITSIWFTDEGRTIHATGGGYVGDRRHYFCLRAVEGQPDRFRIGYWATDSGRSCNNPRFYFNGRVTQGNVDVYPPTNEN
jgi:hypothetical protein